MKTTFTSVADWTGLLGGLAGIISLIVTMWALWMNRSPSLHLFAPHYFVGLDAKSRVPVLNVLLRISNASERSAFLYLETMSVEMDYDGKWVQMLRLETDPDKPIQTDFSDSKALTFGLKHCRYLPRFGNPVISRDNPLSGFIALAGDSSIKDLKWPLRMRLKVFDCHFVKHVLEVNFTTQRERFDPDYKRGEFASVE